MRVSPFWHSSLAFCAYFASTGAHLPFWPLWLADWGLSEAEIGAYAAVGVAARIVAGFVIPILADRLDQRRLSAAAATVLAGFLFFAHAWMDSRSGLLLLTALATGLILGAMPILETLGAVAARRHSFDFAKARGLGSLAFLLASIISGLLVAYFGIDIIRWWILLALILAALLMLRHPGGGVAVDRPSLGEILALFKEKRVLLLALTVAYLQASHGVLYAYGSLHWRALGYSEATIGWLWAVSVIAEVALMMFAGRRLVRILSPEGALIGAGLCGALRFALMAGDPATPYLVVLQMLHAASFGLAHLGMMAFVSEKLPERMSASALALANSLVGGSLVALSMLGASLLYPQLGGLTYLTASAASAIAVVFGICLMRCSRS